MKIKTAMSLRTLVMTVSFVLFVLFIIVSTAMLNNFMMKHALLEANDRAERILQRNVNINKYFREENVGDGYSLTDDCVPEGGNYSSWKPVASEAEKINKYLGKIKADDSYYKEAAINARSPKNEADSFERDFIIEMRKNAELNKKSGIVKIDNKPYFYILRRGEAMGSGCMKCHGKPEDAPSDLTKAYGSKRGFFNTPGQAFYAFSIRVPLEQNYRAAIKFTIELVSIMIGLSIILFFTGVYIMDKMLLSPIRTIKNVAIRIAENEKELGGHIAAPSAGRELYELTSAFNTMSSRLSGVVGHLESAVKERTAELSDSNAELQKEILYRKCAEEDLAAERRRYHDILEYMPAFVCIVDINHNIRYANKYFLDQFGDAEGGKCYEIVGNASAPCEKCGINDVIGHGVKTSCEFIHSSEKAYLVNSVPHIDNGEEIMALQIGIDISAQKKAEEKATIFHKFVESSSQGLVMISLGGEMTYLNPKFLHMIGETDMDKLKGNMIYDYYPAVMQTWLKHQIAPEVIVNGEWSGELAITPRNGTTIPTSNSFFLMNDANGRPSHIAGIITDITESKKSEEMLLEKERQYRILVESLNEGIWAVDMNGKTIFANDTMARMLMVRKDEIMNVKFNQFMVDEKDLDMSRLPGEIAAEPNGCVESKLLRSDGETIIAHVSASQITGYAGECIGYIFGVMDITDRKNMEENVVRQAAALSCINSILRETINSESEEDVAEICLEEAMSLTGSEMGLIGELTSDEKLALIAIKQFGADNEYSLDILKASQNKLDISGMWADILKSRNPVIKNNIMTPSDNNLPHGHPEIKRFLGIPLRYDGETIGLIALANKTGEYNHADSESIETISTAFIEALYRKRAKNEKMELIEELRHAQKMEALGSLAGGIAHEFNNLLTRIMGNSDFLLADMKPGDRGYAEIDGVLAAAEEARELTMKILSFAMKDKLSMKDISPNEIVRCAVDILNKGMLKKILVVADLEERISLVRADASQIQQALLNICSNSHDAMRHFGTMTIRTYMEKSRLVKELNEETLTDEDYCVIEVSDTGPGIPENIIDRIFDPFFTTKKVGEASGMGLSVAHGIVTSHGGAIRVSSVDGKGAIFKIYLPAVSSEKEGADESGSDASAVATVLVIDDEEYVLETTKMILENQGYRALTEKDGQSALKTYAERWKEIDLILLDMIIPGFEAHEIYRELKTINPEAKAILISGYGKDKVASKILENGAVGFVHKPFMIKELMKMVNSAIATRCD